MKKILIIVPAYNEEKNIKSVASSLIQNFPGYDYIVINDGSVDRTAGICRDNGYEMIDLPINIGLSAAVQTGMQYAYENRYEAAIQIDGDGQHDPSHIAALAEAMRETGADIVIGSRFRTKRKPCSMRMLGSIILQFLIRITTGANISDPTSGMRLYGRNVLEAFAYQLNYTPEPDTISFLLKKGARICEVQVEIKDREHGKSYLTPIRAIKYMVEMCFSILLIQWVRKKV